jgi:hypothetical protein
MAAFKGMQLNADKISEEEGRLVLAEAEQGRTIAWEAVLLLGSPTVINSARAWHEAMYLLRRAALDGDEDLWSSAVLATSSARREFYLSAKRDLGIPISDAEVYEWQLAKYFSPNASSDGPA